MRKTIQRYGRATLFAAALTAAALSGQPGALARAGRTATAPGAATPAECEGTACAQVVVTFDEVRGQYRAQNNSADSWVRVAAANMADSSSACLAPGKDGYLTLKSIVGTYRADYSEPRCGAPGATE
jgi:hypothetical protein